MQKPYIIAEIGGNHMGRMDLAEEMITIAATFCKVDAVKFQKRTNKELLSPEEYNAPHPNPINSFGDTYGAHREFLEFDKDQHRHLKQFAEGLGIEYSTSVWDITASKEITELNPRFIKIPSASNMDFEVYEYLADHYKGEIHISLGMTYHKEEEEIVEFFTKKGRNKDIVLYSCTSGYPVPFKDVCLLEITRIKQKFGDKVKAIGFSGHHLGIAVDDAALALGATVFERHFTLDRTFKGTDHAASLEPDGMRKLARNIRAISEALQFKPTEILEIEAVQRKKLKRKVAQ
jgi:N-acetylneuraminate synthase